MRWYFFSRLADRERAATHSGFYDDLIGNAFQTIFMFFGDNASLLRDKRFDWGRV
jgi:hypothetical protein